MRRLLVFFRPLLLLFLLLLAARPLLLAQADDHPRYRFRAGGKAQVRRIFQHEEYDHPSPGFVRFRERTSTARLLQLTRRRNPARRLYAALALADRRYPQLAEVFGRLIRTDQLIVMKLPDAVTNAKVPERFYLSGKLYHRLEDLEYEHASVADSVYQVRQLLRLDSVALLLYSQGYPVERHVINGVYYSNHAYPGSYEALRRIVLDRLAAGRLLSSQAHALAQYRHPADVALIQRFDKRPLLSAVAVFPDSAFWPLLRPYAGQENTLDFFEAVAAYRDGRAARLLDSLYRHQLSASPDPLRATLAELAQALTDQYHPVYDSLLVHLWQERQIMSPVEADRFARRDSARAATLFAQGLLGFVPYGENFIVSHPRLGNANYLVADMLRVIRQQDSTLFRTVCYHGIKAFNFPEFDGLCQVLGEQRPAWAVEPILSRLAFTERYSYVFSTTKLLLSYQDPALSRQVAAVLAQKPASLWSGGWRDRFNELLQAHGLAPLPAAR